MADVFTKEKRSQIMSRIRGSRNAATEERLAKLFRKHGITGWRRNYPLFGKPDFVFPKHRVAVFVDGEFWHGHPDSKLPETNREFWTKKIEKNRNRDDEVNRTLQEKGWTVMRIWQKELRCEVWRGRLFPTCK